MTDLLTDLKAAVGEFRFGLMKPHSNGAHHVIAHVNKRDGILMTLYRNAHTLRWYIDESGSQLTIIKAVPDNLTIEKILGDENPLKKLPLLAPCFCVFPVNEFVNLHNQVRRAQNILLDKLDSKLESL